MTVVQFIDGTNTNLLFCFVYFADYGSTGTVFAYGQTSSGKTYVSFFLDIAIEGHDTTVKVKVNDNLTSSFFFFFF